jgi:endonuclease/exonuclease/phosphatase family metal-dependent hydrolase
MARWSRVFAVLAVVAMVAIAIAAVVLRSRLECAGFAGAAVTASELPPPAPAASLRIATWNIRNFPFDERPQDTDLGYARNTNICDLEEALGGLDADLLGVAEIRDTRRFPQVLRRSGGGRRYQVALAKRGGRFGQKVGIAWDEAVFELMRDPQQIDELALDPKLRPGLALSLRHRRPGGDDFTVVQVHLVSRPEGYTTRLRQIRELARWVNEWTTTVGDRDIIVMGDFNTTGPPGRDVERELDEVDAILGASGLRRLPNPLGCDQYSEGGGPRDGIQQPSLLDHVYLGGFEAAGEPELRSWLHCARHACQPFTSRAGEEDGTFWDVSDHCPVTFELPVDTND